MIVRGFPTPVLGGCETTGGGEGLAGTWGCGVGTGTGAGTGVGGVTAPGTATALTSCLEFKYVPTATAPMTAPPVKMAMFLTTMTDVSEGGVNERRVNVCVFEFRDLEKASKIHSREV